MNGSTSTGKALIFPAWMNLLLKAACSIEIRGGWILPTFGRAERNSPGEMFTQADSRWP
jgi:hypothetical protein